MTLPHEVNPKIIKLTDRITDSNDKNALFALRNYNNICIRNRTCSNCESDVQPKKYKGLIKDEYFVSGLCKKCQPWFFDEPGKKIS
jgi:hypothetical protein|tara:strand:+ start:180 stop:437 length:258 start_codon:yes stop_codon:yes gene_type:complete